MSLSDPIGDMIARVKNAQARSYKKVDLPSSNFKTKIADILIFPILDIKIPYKLFHHQLFVFLHLYQS